MKKNLVIFTQNSLQSYEDYGIGIPMRNSRVVIPFENLKNKYNYEETDLNYFNELTIDDLSLCHTKEFVDKVNGDPESVVLATYELVNSDGSYNRFDPKLAKKPLTDFIAKGMLHVNGTFLAAKNALENGFCYHLGGGMHHAMSHRPGGFCMFSDIVIAIRKLQKLGKIKNALVIDMDAHKGDGTAQITCADNTIKTYSIHMKEGWPLNDPGSIDSQTPSDKDVGVLATDNYLEVFKSSVTEFLSENKSHFDLCLVVHGADVYEYDELPSASLIKLTKDEVFSRDQFIFNILNDLNIPQAWVMAGGYGDRVHEIFWQFIDFAAQELS